MYDVVKTLILLFKEAWYFFKRGKKGIKESIDIGNKIDTILDSLIVDTSADRAFVFQFHNGQYFYTGNSIDKMTNTHERALNGISYEQLKYREVGTAPFRFLIEKIVKMPIYTCDNTKNISHYNTKLMMVDRGAKSFAMKIMLDPLRRPVGFVGIEFVKERKDISSDNMERLQHATDSIYETLIYGKTQ